MQISSYKDLVVWQKAMLLVKSTFLLTASFPENEMYGLTSQMRRAAVAIPSNIAEGYGRHSSKSYIQFLSIAYGSGLELETQLLIVKDLRYCSDEVFHQAEQLLTEVLKMLHTLRTKLKGERVS